MKNTYHQTIIIGAGPAGSSASVYLARFCHDVAIINAGGKVPGRTGMASGIKNLIGTQEAIKGSDFLKQMRIQREEYDIPTYKTKVEKAAYDEATKRFIIETDTDTYEATYLVLAVGVADNMPEIEGLDPYYDSGIFHCLTCDWYDHKEQPSAIIANDDRGIVTALTLDAMYRPPLLSVIPAKQPNFSPEMLAKAQAKDITVYPSPLKEVRGTMGQLNTLILEDGTEVTAEVFYTKLGHTRNDTFLDKGGITVDREPEENFIKVNWRTFESSFPNLFAVGPCNDGPDQVVIAAGEGALAAMEIHRRIIDNTVGL